MLRSLKSFLVCVSNTLLWFVDTVFNIKPPANAYLSSLADAFTVKSLDYLNCKCGGIEDVVLGLNSNQNTGICGDTKDLASRRRACGSNTYQEIPQKSFSRLMLEQLNDTFKLIQLICCAVVYIVKLHGLDEGFFGIIMFFISFVPVMSGSIIYRSTETYYTCKQLKELWKASTNIQSKVIRNGILQLVPFQEIVVGDVVILATGDVVPADGLVLATDDWFLVDESIWKGEGNIVKLSRNENPFLSVGTKVVNGCAGMIVISVGINTTWGNLIRLVTSNPDGLSLERVRIIKITEFLDKFSPAAFFLIVFMLVK